MERLTERYKDPIANTVLIRECGDKLCKDICDDIECDCSKCELGKALEKLAAYEDLEEQGLLVRLPDDLLKGIYRITYKYTECSNGGETKDCCENYNCSRECDSRKELYIVKNRLEFMLFCNYYNELGKTIFLTREKAKKKLEEMKAVEKAALDEKNIV